LIRESVRMVLQELIEVETGEVIGAARYGCTATRRIQRNGHRDRHLSTQAGDVSLQILKLRRGAFFPVIQDPRRRDRSGLHAGPKPMRSADESQRVEAPGKASGGGRLRHG